MNIKCHIRLPFGLTNNNKMFFSLAGVWCVCSIKTKQQTHKLWSCRCIGSGGWRWCLAAANHTPHTQTKPQKM